LRVALAVVLGLPALFALRIIIWDSRHRRPFDFVIDRPYPVVAVIVSCMLVIGEAAVLWVFLAAGRSRTLCWRALTCFCLTACAALLLQGFDQPPYEDGHASWMFLAALILALVFALSGAARLVLFGRSLWRRAP
jgi:hypothetical protein